MSKNNKKAIIQLTIDNLEYLLNEDEYKILLLPFRHRLCLLEKRCQEIETKYQEKILFTP